jgi:hypothetical protein
LGTVIVTKAKMNPEQLADEIDRLLQPHAMLTGASPA